jgi:hypothetical protein
LSPVSLLVKWGGMMKKMKIWKVSLTTPKTGDSDKAKKFEQFKNDNGFKLLKSYK